MSNEKHPETWLSLVESCGHGLIEDEILSSLDQANECLLMGLRLDEGLDVVRAETLAGQPLDQETLHRLMEEGLVETVSNHHLRVTTKGRPVLNAIVRALSF
jgi:coproporphyrinogen III oxidase-like Fe-S oxidoreductase